MNEVKMYGRLTRDLDLRYAPNSGYAYLFNSIAVDRYDKKSKEVVTDFFNIVVGGKKAETLATYSKKGARVIISGYLRNSKYEKNGEKRISTEIFVEKQTLVDIYKTNNQDSFNPNEMELIDEEMPEVFMQEIDFLK